MRRTAHHAPVRTTSHCTTTVNGLAEVGDAEIEALPFTTGGKIMVTIIGTAIQAGVGAGAGALAAGKGRRGKGALIGAGVVGGVAFVGNLLIEALSP